MQGVATLGGVECRVGGEERLIYDGFREVVTQLRAAGSIWLFGNGGSGTIADHIACDLVLKGLRAFALTNQALTTTFANDLTFRQCFAQQLKVQASPGDALVAMSCSGESENVVDALALRDAAQAFRVTLSGFEIDNRLRDLGDVSFWVPSDDYGTVQVCHLAILHAVADMVESRA